MSKFDDISAFLGAKTSESSASGPPPIPEGEYPMEVIPNDDVEWRKAEGTISKGDRAGQPWANIQIPCRITEGEHTGRRAPYTVWFAFTPDGEDIDWAKTFDLGRIREATGTNSGEFTLRRLEGRRFKGLVGHRQGNDGNEYPEVRKVAALS